MPKSGFRLSQPVLENRVSNRVLKRKNYDAKKFKLPVNYVRKITLQVKSNTPLLDLTCPFTPKY